MSTLSLMNRLEEIVSSVCLVAMTLVIGMQVFNRYVIEQSLDWSEELGRYLFIWAVYVGCSYAMKEDRHLEVTIIRNYASPRANRFIVATTLVLTIVFCLFCVVYGIQMMQLLMTTGQNTPALEIKMYWIFAAVPVGLGLMALRAGVRLWQLISSKEPPAAFDPTKSI